MSDLTTNNWKCPACGIDNGYANIHCAVCGGARPVEAGAPANFVQPHAYDPGFQKTARMRVPAGIIVLVVFEALMIVYGLYYSLVVTPAIYRGMEHQFQQFGSQFPGGQNPFPQMMSMQLAMGVAMSIFWGAVRGFIILVFLMRWSFGRILGIVRYALIVAGGVFGLLGAVIGMMAMSAMKSGMGMPPGARTPFPTMNGFPYGQSMAHAMGLGMLVSFIGLCVGVFGLFYLTTRTAKEYFSN